jgi:hypothetical protein
MEESLSMIIVLFTGFRLEMRNKASLLAAYKYLSSPFISLTQEIAFPS